MNLWRRVQQLLYSRTLFVLFFVFCILAFVVHKILYLVASPGGDKDCDPLYPEYARDGDRLSNAAVPALAWSQTGGVVNDASCLDETMVAGVVAVQSEEDIRAALAYARTNSLKVSVAGVKHSMGGHAFAKGNLVLDMTGFKAVRVDPEQGTIVVQSGATWHDIQTIIHPKFAVKAMQSTDIFTVGGSISVNAHGMDHRVGAVENSIRWIRVMLSDGSIVRISRDENEQLYELVIGGYGLFGVILDAELELVPNELYTSRREMVRARDFPTFFDEVVAPDERIGLMYAHLSTAPGSFLDEGITYIYERVDDEVGEDELSPLQDISSVKLRRLVLNLSKYGGAMQTMRWWMEKYVEPKLESCTLSRNEAIASGEACLVSRNEPMHDSVHYLKNSLKRETDILHEYFIPRRNITAFIDDMRGVLRANDTNLLNASIRVVNKERGTLTYAPEPAFSVVLYINQSTDAAGNAKMQNVTRELIDLAIEHEGRFFLPYQLHYTYEQLRRAYPTIDSFFTLKRLYDPEELLTNTWYERYSKDDV
jgi:FAD/FMN-containing dehydrogenase